jgi:hypothetical protein
MKNTSQRRRAQYGMGMVVILNLGVYIWSIVMQSQFQKNSPGKIDWDEDLYARSFLPYFFVQTTGPLSQSYMYWLLSSFATDAQGKFIHLLAKYGTDLQPMSEMVPLSDHLRQLVKPSHTE